MKPVTATATVTATVTPSVTALPLTDSLIRVVQAARTDSELTHVASPEATAAEVKASTNSCVVHLCGCD